MRAGPGATEIEYVAIVFPLSVLAEDLSWILENACLDVLVNGIDVASSHLEQLPMDPPMSGRVLFHIGYEIHPGDDITACVRTLQVAPQHILQRGLTIQAELSIKGELRRDAKPCKHQQNRRVASPARPRPKNPKCDSQ